MKQHISAEQLSELTQEQLDRLWVWWMPSKGDWYYYPKINHVDVINSSLKTDLMNIKMGHSPLLSIGQCIELLRDARGEYPGIFCLGKEAKWFIGETERKGKFYESDEHMGLIDALWQAVKEAL